MFTETSLPCVHIHLLGPQNPYLCQSCNFVVIIYSKKDLNPSIFYDMYL